MRAPKFLNKPYVGDVIEVTWIDAAEWEGSEASILGQRFPRLTTLGRVIAVTTDGLILRHEQDIGRKARATIAVATEARGTVFPWGMILDITRFQLTGKEKHTLT